MFELTCRQYLAGKGVVPIRPFGHFGDPATAGLDQWVIFIHGYNNSYEDANQAWHETISALEARDADLSRVVLFYWPGDLSRWQVASKLLYPRAIGEAEQAADLLSAYLARVHHTTNAPARVSFVGHSMGCLVTLQTVRLLQARAPGLLIEHVLLMAAAVPEGYCLSGEAYGARCGREETVLFSHEDTVLGRYFEPGQEAAHRYPPRRREAVGRTGGPSAGIGRRWSANVRMETYKHGHYWRREESIDEIAALLPRLPAVSALRKPHRVEESAIFEDQVWLEQLALSAEPPRADIYSPLLSRLTDA